MLFDDLNKEEREALEAICSIETHPAGKTLIHDGEEGRTLCIVLSGSVEVRKELANDQYKKLKTCQANDFFGDMSFLGVAPRSADVVALEDCQVLELPLEAFESLIAERPAIGVAVYRALASGLAHRLKKNTEDLKKAVLWALSGMEV